jgi:hypothetical protein
VEADPILRAVERNSLLAGAAFTLAALLVPPRPEVALGAAAGAVLVYFSYWSLKRGVSMLAELMAGDVEARENARANRGRELRNLVFRYALLVLLAYVMIARLRLHPWGLLAGASSVVAGVSIEAFRLVFWKKS